MKTSRSLIFTLAKEIQRQRTPRTKKHRRHYDDGMPIDLRYDDGYYTAAPAPAAKARSASLSVPGRDFLASPFANSAPGVVESFEDEEEDSGGLPEWGTGQMEEEEEEQQQTEQTNFQQAVQAVVPRSLSAPIPDRQSTQPPPSPAATRATSPRPAPSALPNSTPTDDPDTRAFQDDLAAILQGKKAHPSVQNPNLQEPPDSNEETDESPPPPPAQPPAQPAAMTHDIFERMGHPMSMAQTFNLGSFALDRQLDTFDREIERKERAKAASLPSAPPPPPIRPAPVARAATAINISYNVPLVPQQTGMSCWAAGCAMIVGWRDQMSIDPSEIARATGTWAQYQAGLEPENTSIFPIWGMAPEPAQCYTVEGFCDLLERYGPLWVASAEPGAHIRVVTGASGDGTPDGTTLYINDPWESGMTAFRLPNAGSQTSESYTAFVRKQETLARRESNVQGIYVAHCSQPRT